MLISRGSLAVDRSSDPAAAEKTTRRSSERPELTLTKATSAFDLELGGLAAIVRSSHQAIVTVDRDVRFVSWNAGAERMMGYAAAEVIGQRAPEVIVPGERTDESRMLHQRALAGETIERFETQRRRKDGSLADLELSVYPVSSPDGEITGMGMIARDITEERHVRDRLQAQAELIDLIRGGPGSGHVGSHQARTEHTLAQRDERVRIERVRVALEREAFVLHAQPIIDLRTGEVELRELLLRMTGEHGALIAPGEFLPTAERCGLIGQIDRWVIGEAARLAGSGTRVTFNVSAVSLADPQLASWIEAATREHGVAPDAVVCEITETAMVKHPRNIEAFVDRLATLGCAVALDDFGTGYGGFTYLKQLPVSYLKIAAEFVGDLTGSAASEQIVEAIVRLARGFGLKTIAEGVEDPSTLDLLRQLDVDYAQGFAIARPGPADS
jgi:PAS domain S-box-containing protein